MEDQERRCPTTIMQKVEEMKQWQRQQQEKLFRRQQEQRELLSREHKRLYEVFGLEHVGKIPIQTSLGSIESAEIVCKPNGKIFESDACMLGPAEEVIFGNIHIQEPNHSETNAENRDELNLCNSADSVQHSVPNSDRPSNSLNMPVCPQNFDGDDFAEDKPIEVSSSNFQENMTKEIKYGDTLENRISAKAKVKRPFLKKGQGLARFRMTPEDIKLKPLRNPAPTIRTGSLNVASGKGKSVEGTAGLVSGHTNNTLKPSTATARSGSSNTSKLVIAQPYSVPKLPLPKLQLRKSIGEVLPNPPVATWAKILKQSDQQTKPSAPLFAAASSQEGNLHDSVEISLMEKIREAEKKSKKESEELRAFELLEQYASNSSFCSNSSLVAQLMEKSIKSTPLKNKNHTAKSQDNNCNQQQCEENQLGKVVAAIPYGTDFGTDEESISPAHSPYKTFPRGVVKKAVSGFFGGSHISVKDSIDVQHNTVKRGGCQAEGNEHNTSLHVRFADKHEYKTFVNSSDCQDKHFSDASDCYVLDNVKTSQFQEHKSNGYFEDEKEWSEDCSCESCDEHSSGCCHSLSSSQSNEYDEASCEVDNFESSRFVNHEHSDQMCDGPQTSTTIKSGGKKLRSFRKRKMFNHKPENLKLALKSAGVQTDLVSQETSANNIIFKSTLLKSRLEELENEIETFKKENAKLAQLKLKHENDVKEFLKERREIEQRIEDERSKSETKLAEERKKLAREKQVFEKYCKEIRNQPTKQEREEIASLKEQLAILQEEIRKKDSKWSATQVRNRTRVQNLEKENQQLQTEVAKLKAEKQESTKRVRFDNAVRNKKVYGNTRKIHEINEHLGQMKQKDLEDIVTQNIISKKRIPASILRHKKPQQASENENSYLRRVSSVPDMRPVLSTEALNFDIATNLRNMASNFIATGQEINTEALSYSPSHSAAQGSNCSSENEDSDTSVKKIEVPIKQCEVTDEDVVRTVYEAFYGSSPERQNYSKDSSTSSVSDSGVADPSNCRSDVDPSQHLAHFQPASHNVQEDGAITFDKSPESTTYTASSEVAKSQACRRNPPQSGTVIETCLENGNREKVYIDGRHEIWYPNGNVKKISADGKVVKLIYYNGDVKETIVDDNTVKYYYAQSRTWHTTYSDGLELLEFPDGQVERHMSDGLVEVTYPDGSSRVRHPSGEEQWVFRDGTSLKVDKTGTEVLQLPNGQREIHAKDYKRREYPDGTVKLLYSDGLQETRYANGRVRLKDKDGNVLMDSATS